jgi:hypothetical protein
MTWIVTLSDEAGTVPTAVDLGGLFARDRKWVRSWIERKKHRGCSSDAVSRYEMVVSTNGEGEAIGPGA